jgi:hypothetical protein
MAINKRAVPAADAGEKFIAKAEGGEHAVRWVRGNRTQITVSIAPDLLRRVDAIAQQENLSRAALLTVWINDQIRRRDAAAREAA